MERHSLRRTSLYIHQPTAADGIRTDRWDHLFLIGYLH